MAYEIERKFLIKRDSWRDVASKPAHVMQAYILRGRSMYLRVRIQDQEIATLTIKSSSGNGIRKLEFEYEIPLTDGKELLAMRTGEVVEKFRYIVPQGDLKWEIDVFAGRNEGLVIAEMELPHEMASFARPEWLGREVTTEQRYSNASLSTNPFRLWRD